MLLIFQAHPIFKMLLSICISYMFQIINLISYLVFKLEDVAMAGCQVTELPSAYFNVNLLMNEDKISNKVYCPK